MRAKRALRCGCPPACPGDPDKKQDAEFGQCAQSACYVAAAPGLSGGPRKKAGRRSRPTWALFQWTISSASADRSTGRSPKLAALVAFAGPLDLLTRFAGRASPSGSRFQAQHHHLRSHNIGRP